MTLIRTSALCLLVLMGGCNTVVSDRPLLMARDGQPHLKVGLWRQAEEADCSFDETQPLQRWPDCASALYFDGKAMTLPDEFRKRDRRRAKAGGGHPGPVSTPFVIEMGPPLVGQAEQAQPRKKRSKRLKTIYWYFLIQPTDMARDGTIKTFEMVAVSCGPVENYRMVPQGGTTSVEGKSMITRHPLAGLKMVEGNCMTNDRQALFAAARGAVELAKVNNMRPSHYQWVREQP
jgi:hypothetical protein